MGGLVPSFIYFAFICGVLIILDKHSATVLAIVTIAFAGTAYRKAVGQSPVPRLSSHFVSADPDALFQLHAVEVHQALEKVFNAAAHIKALLSIHSHNIQID